MREGEIIADLFAGGGGTSEGIRWALGRDPDIAINHDAVALAMHIANHPGTEHLHADIWEVPPPFAEALVSANCEWLAVGTERKRVRK